MIQVQYMYDQLLRTSDKAMIMASDAMRESSFFHPLVLQGE